LSILVTVFGTASRNEATNLVGKFLATASPAARAQFQRTGQLPGQISAEILAHGISTAFQFAVLFALLALVISLVVIQARPTGPPRDAGTPVPSETVA
ncbi:MAG TPA: MFS transporter, partial [Actinomycetes bacterium]|nr:MFS transporter [Actinomycetes bacterium]